MQTARMEFDDLCRTLSHDLGGSFARLGALADLLGRRGSLQSIARVAVQRIGRTGHGIAWSLRALVDLARASLISAPLDRVSLEKAIRSAWRGSPRDPANPALPFAVDPLPEVAGDAVQLRALFSHLLVELRSSIRTSRWKVEGTAGPHGYEVEIGPGSSAEAPPELDSVPRLAEFLSTSLHRRIADRHGGRILLGPSPAWRVRVFFPWRPVVLPPEANPAAVAEDLARACLSRAEGPIHGLVRDVRTLTREGSRRPGTAEYVELLDRCCGDTVARIADLRREFR